MKKLLLPVVFVVAGVGAGVGAGLFLKPGAASGKEHGAAGETHDAAADHAAADPHAADDHGGAEANAKPAAGHGGGGSEQFVKLGNQFIVPVLEASRVRSLVVLSIDLEVGPGGVASVYRVEPKIRDAFLTVLFDHANAGGFNGTFTSSGSMEILRTALREAGKKAVGSDVITDVLITGIVRQDV